MKNAESGLGLGLAKTYHTIALFPQTALFKELNTFKTLQYASFGRHTTGCS
jgi:hypothetical protein|tara:strand:+ start:887 stop:1039 length:153 start_codon:yes stop_codon:yes gene_type:complete